MRGYAVSEQATALVRHLAHKHPRVAQGSTGTKRTNKPRKLEANFHQAIGAMLAALLVARADEEAAGWFRISLDKEDFKRPAPVAYRMFMAIRSSWRDAGLIEEHRGYPGSLAFGNPGPANGMMTRFRATPALIKICEQHGVVPPDVSGHFISNLRCPMKFYSSRSQRVRRQTPPLR